MDYELRLYKDEVAPGAIVSSMQNTSGVAATYVVAGTLRVRTGALAVACSANSAFFLREAAEISGGNLPAHALRWVLQRAGDEPALQPAQGVTTSLLLSAPLALDEAKKLSAALRPRRLSSARRRFPAYAPGRRHTMSFGRLDRDRYSGHAPSLCAASGVVRGRTRSGVRSRFRNRAVSFRAPDDPAALASRQVVDFVRQRGRSRPTEKPELSGLHRYAFRAAALVEPGRKACREKLSDGWLARGCSARAVARSRRVFR